MPEDFLLPAVAAAVLLWCLLCALRQRHTEPSAEPTLVWREATASGWSDWRDLTAVAPSTDYAGALAAIRARANSNATAVQFASVVHPTDAPAFTLRVLFVSEVWALARDRAGATTQ